MTTTAPQPGHELLREVRAGFVRQGKTLTAWCNEHGISVSNARQAVIGSWNGPKARSLRARISRAAQSRSPQ